MNAQEITLNIAVNLGRLGRWVDEGKISRVGAFLVETEDYLVQLEKAQKSPKFEKTFEIFKTNFEDLKNNSNYDKVWAEEALTWANILQHRSRLT